MPITRTFVPATATTVDRWEITGTADSEVIFGAAITDFIYGLGGNDEMHGLDGNNVIHGGDGNDRIYGGISVDVLDGGPGRDRLTGGLSADFFNFGAAAEAAGDWITDFSKADDFILLDAIDANLSIAGDQAFTWIGTAPFTAAGQLRYFQQGGNTIVQGNTAGNLLPEFEIGVVGLVNFAPSDFVL